MRQKLLRAFLLALSAVSIASADILRTPMDEIFKEDKKIFKEYGSFIANHRGGKTVLVSLISKQSKTLGFYEAIVKAMYQRYHLGQIDSNMWKKASMMLFDAQSDRLKDSIEGVYVQNMLIEIGKIKEAQTIISDPFFCTTLKKDLDRKGCFANNIFLNCLTEDPLLPFAISVSPEMRNAQSIAFKKCKAVLSSKGDI